MELRVHAPLALVIRLSFSCRDLRLALREEYKTGHQQHDRKYGCTTCEESCFVGVSGVPAERDEAGRGDSFTLYLLQSSPICLAVSNQSRAHSDVKCKDGFVLAWLADVTQLEELGTVLTSGVQYHVAVTYEAGGYEWGDGQPVDGALWASGVPSAGMCGAVQGSGSTRLTGVNCATKAKYICRNTTQSCSDATTIKPLPSAAVTTTAVTPTTTASTHQPTTLHTDPESTTLPSEFETTSQSKVETTSQSKVETTSQSEVETTSLSEVETTSQSDVETTSQSEVETTSQSEVETTSQPEVETTSQSEVETTSQSEVETTSQSEVETTSQSEPDSTTSQLNPLSTTPQIETERTSHSEHTSLTSHSDTETTSLSQPESPASQLDPKSTTPQSDTESSSQLKADTTETISTKHTVSDETMTTQGPTVTSQSGDTAPPLTSQPQYRACRCQRAVQTNATARAARVQEAVDSAERLRLDLTLAKHNLSSAVRTKTSARDDRWSARAAGGVSIACLVLVCVTVILLDLPHLAPLLASLTATVGIDTDHTHSACDASSGDQDTSSQPSVGDTDTSSQPSVGDTDTSSQPSVGDTDTSSQPSVGVTDKSSVASCVANDTSLCSRDERDDQIT